MVVGKNGSGKSTLLTLIGALRSVEEGSLKVLNRELLGASEADLMAVRRRIGFIFQSHNLVASLTVLQNSSIMSVATMTTTTGSPLSTKVVPTWTPFSICT